MAAYFFSHGDAATTPPDTDEAPALCTACGRAECDCGNDDGAASPRAAERAIDPGATPNSSRVDAQVTAGTNPVSPSFGQVPVSYRNLREGIFEKLAELDRDHRRRGGVG